MFLRQLRAIGYPQADVFTADDENDFRQLVSWLETNKLNYLANNSAAASMREVLTNIADDKNWNAAFTTYLSDVVQSRFDPTDRSSTVSYLIQLAVRADYARNADKFVEVKPANHDGNMFDKMTPAQVKAGVDALAQLLNLPRHYDDMVMLRAVAHLLRERLSEPRLKELEASGDSDADKIRFELADIAEGMDVNNEQLSVAAKALRLLHIRNLRELQTMVDEVIVVAQVVTADPQTDQRLGKVGR